MVLCFSSILDPNDRKIWHTQLSEPRKAMESSSKTNLWFADLFKNEMVNIYSLLFLYFSFSLHKLKKMLLLISMMNKKCKYIYFLRTCSIRIEIYNIQDGIHSSTPIIYGQINMERTKNLAWQILRMILYFWNFNLNFAVIGKNLRKNGQVISVEEPLIFNYNISNVASLIKFIKNYIYFQT